MVLPQSMRLKGHRCFDHIHRFGTKFYSPSIVLRIAKARPELLKHSKCNPETTTCRCAVAISSKVNKRSVVRNRLRRIFHSYLNQKLSKLEGKSNTWALISLRPAASDKEPTPLLSEFDSLLTKAGLI